MRFSYQKAHEYFGRGQHYYNRIAVVGKYADYMALKGTTFQGTDFDVLVHVNSPMKARSFKFDKILVFNELSEDQMELLNWLRFLKDPTEGLLPNPTKNVIILR